MPHAASWRSQVGRGEVGQAQGQAEVGQAQVGQAQLVLPPPPNIPTAGAARSQERQRWLPKIDTGSEESQVPTQRQTWLAERNKVLLAEPKMRTAGAEDADSESPTRRQLEPNIPTAGARPSPQRSPRSPQLAQPAAKG